MNNLHKHCSRRESSLRASREFYNGCTIVMILIITFSIMFIPNAPALPILMLGTIAAIAVTIIGMAVENRAWNIAHNRRKKQEEYFKSISR